MKMKYLSFFPFLFLFVFAQNDQKAIRDYYHYSLHDLSSLETTIEFGLGTLQLSANDKPKQLDGTVFYYSKVGKPVVSLERLNSHGDFDFDLEIDHHRWGNVAFSLKHWDFEMDDIKNEMDFQLPIGIPTELDLEFGLGEADIDLTHISISDFNLECGLSDVNVIIQKPNPIFCDEISIEIGMADFNGRGLGNLNGKDYRVDIGLGDADVDLSGSFSQDATLEVNVGLGSINLVLPKNVNITLVAEHSFLASIDIDDLEKLDENEYQSLDWEKGLPTLEVEISVGLGDVDVRVSR